MMGIVSLLALSAPTLSPDLALAIVTGASVVLLRIVGRPEPWRILGRLANRVERVGPARFTRAPRKRDDRGRRR